MRVDPVCRRWRRSALDVGHHVLDAGVVVEAVHRKVLAVAGVLEPSVWHFSDQWNVRVDPHASEVETLGHAHCPTEVFGPDAGRESVLDSVAESQSFGFI